MKQILEKQYTARYIRNGFKFRSHIKWFYFKSHVEKSSLKYESSAKHLSLFQKLKLPSFALRAAVILRLQSHPATTEAYN